MGHDILSNESSRTWRSCKNASLRRVSWCGETRVDQGRLDNHGRSVLPSVRGVDQYIDIAAEKLIGAKRGDRRIAVEVKSFTGPSMVTEFHSALGQFLHYRMAREKEDPDRILYLAVPVDAFDSFFSLLFARTSVQLHGVHLIVYDPESEALIQWIKQRNTES
jgi:hypothetical protein